MKPQEYVDFWDEYISTWHKDFEKVHLNSLKLWNEFFEKRPFDITKLMYHRYTPEPYFGNPLSTDLKAVFINKNPGEGGVEQNTFPKGPMMKAFEKSECKYSKTMNYLINEFVLGNREVLKHMHDWWGNYRVNWVRQIFNINATFKDIVALELAPWHTKSFGEINHLLSFEELNRYVLGPAIQISKNIKNPCLQEGGFSIIIGRGVKGTKALENMFDFQPCTENLPVEIIKRWNVTRSKLNKNTLLIDFSRKGGGFNMQLPSFEQLPNFFTLELKKMQTSNLTMHKN